MVWYKRFFGGIGIQKKRTTLALGFGSAFHSGAEALLTGDVEAAVAKAHLYLDLAFSNEAIDIEEAEVAYAVSEQKAIVEGLIRGWWVHEGERFLRDFEILEVEQEGEAELADGIVLQFRPDALVRERQTGDLFIVSWKTASTFGPWTMNQCQTDMQSMSEVWGRQNAEQIGLGNKLGGNHTVPNNGDSNTASESPSWGQFPAIEGVLYIFSVKGQRKKDDYTGTYRQNSPLAYCWVRKGATDADTEFAWKYAWDTEEINERTGKPKGTKLGQGFRLMPVWEAYPGGVKQWIEDLAAQRIAPRHLNALDQAFPQSLPVSRRADEIADWREQVATQEQDLQNKVQWAEKDSSLVNKLFPQHTHSCYSFASKCQFFDCCWNPAIKADPLASGLYQIAVPNHPKGAGDDEE